MSDTTTHITVKRRWPGYVMNVDQRFIENKFFWRWHNVVEFYTLMAENESLIRNRQVIISTPKAVITMDANLHSMGFESVALYE